MGNVSKESENDANQVLRSGEGHKIKDSNSIQNKILRYCLTSIK